MSIHPYLYLIGAIASEVIATTALNISSGFEKPLPILVVVAGYLSSFYLVSLSLTELPVGLAYATWAGIGLIGVAVIGVVVFGEQIDGVGVVGIGLILAGVYILNVMSNISVQ